MSVRADRLMTMSPTPDSAVRSYIQQHRAAFLDDVRYRLQQAQES